MVNFYFYYIYIHTYIYIYIYIYKIEVNSKQYTRLVLKLYRFTGQTSTASDTKLTPLSILFFRNKFHN